MYAVSSSSDVLLVLTACWTQQLTATVHTRIFIDETGAIHFVTGTTFCLPAGGLTRSRRMVRAPSWLRSTAVPIGEDVEDLMWLTHARGHRFASAASEWASGALSPVI